MNTKPGGRSDGPAFATSSVPSGADAIGDDGRLREGRPGPAPDARPPLALERSVSARAAALDDYLALRRSLGYKLERAGVVLADFVAYLNEAAAEDVTVHLALDRLVAIDSFFSFAFSLPPEHAGLIQRVLAIPVKPPPHACFERRTVYDFEAARLTLRDDTGGMSAVWIGRLRVSATQRSTASSSCFNMSHTVLCPRPCDSAISLGGDRSSVDSRTQIASHWSRFTAPFE